MISDSLENGFEGIPVITLPLGDKDSVECEILSSLLHFMNKKVSIQVDPESKEISVTIPPGEDICFEREEPTLVSGFLPCLLLVGKWARVFPSSPLESGLVMQSVLFALNSEVDELEDHFSKKEVGSSLCDGFEGSTVSDFVLHSRLKRYEKEIDEASPFESYPFIAEYLSLPPENRCVLFDLKEEVEEGSPPEEEIVTGRRCSVS